MYCKLREGAVLSGVSTALPTPASSDCSSRGPHAASMPNQQFVQIRPGRAAPNSSEVVDYDMAVSSNSGAARKALSPPPSRASRTTSTRGGSPVRTKVSEDLARTGGASAFRSRSTGKSLGSRSSPQSPARSPDISPVRGGSPSAAQGSRQRSISLSRIQASQLEQQLKDSERARSDLEKQLQEERECASSDRAKLARLASRLSNLENSREVSSHLLEDNRVLREQLEVQAHQIQDLIEEIKKVREAAPPTKVVLSSSQERLTEENSRLRQELQESQVMLAKYTNELNQIMPGVELILTQYQKDSEKGPLAETMVAQLQHLGEKPFDADGGYFETPSMHELPPAPLPVASSSQQTAPRVASYAVDASELKDRPQPSQKGDREQKSRARSNGRPASRHSSLSPQPKPKYARAPPPALKSGGSRQGSRLR